MGSMISTMPSLATHNVDITSFNLSLNLLFTRISRCSFVWTKVKHSSCASSGDCLMYACSNYVSRGVLKSNCIDKWVQVDTGSDGKPNADVNVGLDALMHAETTQSASETKPWRNWQRIL